MPENRNGRDPFYDSLRHRLELLSGRPTADLEIDQPFISTGLIDSLAIVDLITFIEETHSIVVDPMDLSADNFGTMSAIHAYVERQRGDAG